MHIPQFLDPLGLAPDHEPLRFKTSSQLANETISKGVQVADGSAVRVALGEVYFRQGKISEAEREWVNAINSGHLAPRAYLGLVRVDKAMSLYKKAKDKMRQGSPNSIPTIPIFSVIGSRP